MVNFQTALVCVFVNEVFGLLYWIHGKNRKVTVLFGRHADVEVSDSFFEMVMLLQ